MNISGVDLNLFTVFQAVFDEGSTVRAARRLSVTQSAVSNALARLRETLDDPLFVRCGRGLVPTPRAVDMRPAVDQALQGITSILAHRFDPATESRTFTLACADHHQAADVPPLVAAMAKALPRARLHVVNVDYLIATDGLASGTVDLALAPEGTKGPKLHSIPLFREGSGLWVRRGHPALGRVQSLDDLETLGHIDVHLSMGQAGDVNREVARALADLGFERQVAVVASSFTTAVMIACQTDYVAWLPDHAGKVLGTMADLQLLKSELPQWEVGCSLIWHERSELDPACNYLRKLVKSKLSAKIASPKSRRHRTSSSTQRRAKGKPSKRATGE